MYNQKIKQIGNNLSTLSIYNKIIYWIYNNPYYVKISSIFFEKKKEYGIKILPKI